MQGGEADAGKYGAQGKELHTEDKCTEMGKQSGNSAVKGNYVTDGIKRK
jgi:hypothetical protein